MVQDRYIQQGRVRLAALLLAALLLATFGIGTVSALTWHTETVGSGGTFPSLVLDSAGNPRVSYYDETNQDLKYAAYDGSAWTNRTVDSAGSVGRFNSLALDSAGNPRISYYDWMNSAWESSRHLKYAAWDGSAWQIETVDSAEGVGEYTSLALDAAGNPRISYSDAINGRLKYAAWNGSAWQIQTLDAEGWVGMFSSLALDGAGNPRISYDDATNQNLKYAAWNGSAWQIEIVDSAGSVGRYASLALDRAGNPRISYYDDTNNGLKFAAYDGSAWTFQAVDPAKYAGLCTSLALDRAGNPRISYIDVSTNLLKFAAWNGSAWQTETVDTGGIVGQFSSLALDRAGNPGISYYDYNKAELKYARGEWPPAPAIAITKSVSVDSGVTWLAARTAPGPLVRVGSPVQWRYTVTNTGNVDLTNVTVTDDRGVTVTAPKSTLAAGESMNATAGGTAIEGQYVNNGTATGTYGTQHVSATDISHYLGIALPVAAFSADTTSGLAPLAVRFTNSSSGVIDSRSWDFGDGTTSTEADPTHTFAVAGSYIVNLTVTNIAGSNSTTRTVIATDRPWIAANFTANVTSGVAPLAVRFTDTSTGPVKTWAWEFGDGGTSTEQNPVHVYNSTGTYTVRLLANNYQSADNEIRTDCITVMPNLPVGGDRGYFLVSTNPANATIYLEDISGTRYVKGTTADGPLNVTICLTCTPVLKLIATREGYRDAVFTITSYPPRDMTVPVELNLVPAAVTVPGGTGVPGDLDGDGFCEDVNGNGRVDFGDVVLFFNQMSWIAANEPIALFDYNGNGRIDFADVVWLFTHL